MNCPVLRVYGPLQDGHFFHLGHLPEALSPAASGRPEQGNFGVFRHEVQGGLDLSGNVPSAHGGHRIVGVAVAAQLVARRQHFFRQSWILPDAVAAEEKGGLDISCLQPLQKGLGKPAGGAVVKGQGHGGGLRPGSHREHQAEKKQTQQLSQENASFLEDFV